MLRGFTLLEVLLSVAALSTIAGIGIPVFQSFQVRNDLDVAAVTVAQSARRAQILAEASDGDSNWGVEVAPGAVTLFKGDTFAARDAAYDETFVLPGTITASGLTDIVFAKMTGLPSAVGTLTLTSTINEVRLITFNAKGTVSY